MSPGGDLVSFAIPVFFRGDIFSITYREIFLFIFLLLGNTHCRNRYHSHPVDCFLSGFPKRKKRKGGNYFFPFEGLRSPDLNPIHRGGEKMDHGNGKRYYMIVCFIIVFLGATIFASRAFAFNSFLTEFKTFYSIANGTRLDTCGVCHFNFNGGGSRNPYGQAYTGSSSAINHRIPMEMAPQTVPKPAQDFSPGITARIIHKRRMYPLVLLSLILSIPLMWVVLSRTRFRR